MFYARALHAKLVIPRTCLPQFALYGVCLHCMALPSLVPSPLYARKEKNGLVHQV